MRQISAAIINLGCKVNKYESDAMKDKLMEAGVTIVEPEDVADVYIVNTCSVTNMAQKKSRQMLRRAKRRNPEAVVIAAGCYVNAEHDQLSSEDFVDMVIGNNCKKDIVEEIFAYFEKQAASDFYIDINKTKEYEEMGSLNASHLDHQRAYIKIQDGCNQFCSYCIIPYTRGRVRSRKPEDIYQEIQSLARSGVKEFVLTGIHISSYGVDFVDDTINYDDVMSGAKEEFGSDQEKNKQNAGKKRIDSIQFGLGELVEKIAEISEVERIRLGSLEPRIVTESFLQCISKNNKICPHFHLSLQSACNDTLKRMNRKYTIEEFEEKCNLLRSFYDNPAITTDVIVGFPGETKEEFEITMSNLERINLYEIHVFKYSVRGGTVAEKLPNQIPENIKNERSDILLALTAKQKMQFEKSQANCNAEVLIEEEWDENEELILAHMVDKIEGNSSVKWYVGHTKRYIKVKIASQNDIINSIVPVVIDAI